jgi:D-beta-D-heptose 7-phosphate kinase/D-beta-D-heptose 1-phosphate adenosyltransferase
MKPRILVVGDVLLDRYLHGTVERVNPEAPGVVFRAERIENRLGGAGAVAYLCAGLDCDVTLAGNIGGDEAGDALLEIFEAECIADHCRRTGLTAVKQRCVADGRLMSDRIDWDHGQEISDAQWEARLRACDADQFDCILVADYGRGAAANAVGPLRGKFPGTPILVDPARGADWLRYSGATIIKANAAEAKDAKPLPRCRLIVTDDGRGMSLDGEPISTERLPVLDCCGAGDTVLAVLGWCVARGIDLTESCRLANRAAGVQVQRLGVQQVRPEEIEPTNKLGDVFAFAERARRNGNRIVFTNGCFDVLHAGHVQLLQAAKALGDLLIVGLNSDSSVSRLKGDSRPVNSQEQRAAVLAALECVDAVVVFDGEPTELIERIRPDVLVKGEDYRGREISGAEFAGEVALLPLAEGVSTTRILESQGWEVVHRGYQRVMRKPGAGDGV